MPMPMMSRPSMRKLSLIERISALLSLLIVCVTAKKCEHHFTSSGMGKTGNFSSPNYPLAYSSYRHCRYFFKATRDERIKLSFSVFDLLQGNTAGCLFDYVDIFTIDLSNLKIPLDRICGNELPDAIISVHPRIELVFKSTFAEKGHRGFVGSYEFIDETWQPFPPSGPLCGPAIVTGVGGELTSPGFPAPYPPNSECTWMIRVGNNQKVLINVMTVDMGRSVHCDKSYLSIYNGFASPDTKPAKTLCGQLYFTDPGFNEFKSNSYRVVVRFKANENDQSSSGIRLSWTAVELPKLIEDHNGNIIEEPCNGFLCKGGEYCIDTEGLLCNPLPRYCIDASLRCNDLPNCGVYDQSDEETCLKEVTLLIMSVVCPLIFIVVVAAAVVMWRRKRRRHKHRASKASNNPNTSMKHLNGTSKVTTENNHNSTLEHAGGRGRGRERHRMSNSYVNPPTPLVPANKTGNSYVNPPMMPSNKTDSDRYYYPPNSFKNDFRDQERASCESLASQDSSNWVPPAYSAVVNVNQSSISVVV